MAAELFSPPSKALDANASPYSGAKWKFYASGGLVPLNVFADAGLITSLGAVVTADSAGKFVNIYFDAALSYRGICEDSTGAVTLHDIDPINDEFWAQFLASFATQPEAIAGTASDKLMTPARVREAFEQMAIAIDDMASDETLAAIINRTGLTPQMCGAQASDADHSPFINDMNDRLITGGGGIGWLPAISGDWDLGNAIQCYKTGQQAGNLSLRGVGGRVRMRWLGTTGDAFLIGDGSTPIYDVDFRNIFLYTAGTRSSGIDFNMRKANRIGFQNILTDGSYFGLYGEDVNSIFGDDIEFNMPNQTSGAVAKFYSDPAGGGRCDVIELKGLLGQCRNAGSYGVIADGRVNGLCLTAAKMLGTRRALQLVSASSGAGNIPSFCKFDQFESDRALERSVAIEKAFETEFFGRCNISNTSGAMDSPYPQGSADTVAMSIGSGAIDTKIIGGVIGNCRAQALDDRGKGTTLIGTTFKDMGKDLGNTYAAVFLDGDGFSYEAPNIDGASRATYVFEFGANAKNGTISNVKRKNFVTGYATGAPTNTDDGSTNEKIVTW